MIDYVVDNRSTILEALTQHIWLSLLPVLIGAVCSLPVGYLAVRYPQLYQPVVNLGGLIYSVPSLALFLTLPAVLGLRVLDPLNVVAALSLYTFALLTRTVADALLSVQGQTTQAAFALGYRPVRQLVGVELPMALPVMLAGLRVATVSNISLVSVSAFVGVPNLGSLFTRGLQLDFIEPIVVGIVLSVLLAAICDVAIVAAQHRLTPWSRVGAR